MSSVDDLLIVLGSYSAGYKLMRRRLGGYTGPARFEDIRKTLDINPNTLQITLSRLKRRGLVKKDESIWRLTERGSEYLRRKIRDQMKFRKVFGRSDKVGRSFAKKEKNMILAFDVLEAERRKRNWLRGELTALGFFKLQQSVWFGPSPLPKEFIEAAGRLGLLSYIKFFKASEYDVV